MRRLGGAMVAALLLLSTQLAGAVSYYPPGPQGSVGLSRPTIEQQLVLDEGEYVKSVQMTLDGVDVRPQVDASGRVNYTPTEPLSAGEHQVRISVEIGESTGRYTYAPLVSRFSFRVAEGAQGVLPLPGPEQRRALEHVNGLRTAAGLVPMTYSTALGAAAGGHARYLVTNPDQVQRNAHGETAGTSLFVGATVGARAQFYGYQGGAGEIINFTDRAELAIDGWMDTLYHRIPLLAPGNTELGYGLAGTAENPVNVLVTGPGHDSDRVVLWPYPGQTGVPTGWDGAEEPDPFRLYPDVTGPVGYTITLTYGHTLRSLTLDNWSLRGPEGEVAVLPYDPVRDDLLSDTVSLIPTRPLTPGATYTVTMGGSVDIGQGRQPYSRTWSFTTAPEHQPMLRRMSSTTLSGVVQQVGLDGSGFGQGMRVFLGGLPVGSVTVQSAQRISITPPPGLASGAVDLLLVTPGGREVSWTNLFGTATTLFPAGRSPFSQTPVRVNGSLLGAAALRHSNGTVLLPEEALVQLGALRADVPEIGRTYWTWGGRTGDYMLGRTVASVAGRQLLLGLPAQRVSGRVYVDREFASQLTGGGLWMEDGAVNLGMGDLAGHWARPQIEQLLRDGIVTGTGDGRFRPEETLTRAAFVKMLTAARSIAPQPGKTGGFSDTGSHWVGAQGYIAAAVQAGIVTVAEYPGGKFLPEQPISREEMAVMVTRALGLDAVAKARSEDMKGGTATVAGRSFTDAASWARPGYIAVAVEQGIITGYQESGGSYTFRPLRQATRAEAAVMVVRTLSR